MHKLLTLRYKLRSDIDGPTKLIQTVKYKYKVYMIQEYLSFSCLPLQLKVHAAQTLVRMVDHAEL